MAQTDFSAELQQTYIFDRDDSYSVYNIQIPEVSEPVRTEVHANGQLVVKAAARTSPVETFCEEVTRLARSRELDTVDITYDLAPASLEDTTSAWGATINFPFSFEDFSRDEQSRMFRLEAVIEDASLICLLGDESVTNSENVVGVITDKGNPALSDIFDSLTRLSTPEGKPAPTGLGEFIVSLSAVPRPDWLTN